MKIDRVLCEENEAVNPAEWRSRRARKCEKEFRQITVAGRVGTMKELRGREKGKTKDDVW